jgi:phage terminase large subunit-like protein
MRHAISKKALAAMSEEERLETVAALRALEEIRAVDPLQFFHPHSKQHDLMLQKVPLKAFLGGNRSGKTTVGIVDDLIQAIDRDACPDHLKQYKRWDPPFYCRITTPDFTSTMEGVVFQKLREWAPRAQLVGGAWDKAYDKQNRLLRFANGSWFQFMTYEQDLDKFGGAALHRCHYDEEPPRAIRTECLFRLIDYGGEELFTMTPLLGMSWMFTEIWEPWEKGELSDGHVTTVDMDDNPYLDATTKQRVLGGLSEEERKARKEGRFVHFGGLIYSEFSREKHVRPEILEPQGMEDDEHELAGQTIYVGIDPGQRFMAAVVFCAVDHEGRITVFDEIAMQGATAREVAAEIRLRCARWRVEPRMFIIDPAAQNRLHQTGRSDQMEYADAGIYAVPGQNAVRAGINRVKTYLQTDALTVCANCDELLTEFRRYRWATPKTRGDDDPAEKPIKKDDHLLDALRYVIMARPVRPAAHVEVVDQPLYKRLVEDALRQDTRPQATVSEGGPGRFL